MFSKLSIVLALTLAVLSCAKESKSANPAIEVQLKGTGECLNEMGANLKKYFRGQMSRGDVAEFWDCTGRAIDEYQRLTAGDTPQGHYTPQALRRFLYRYFLKSTPLDDTLLAHLMELKRVMLSGSVTEIRREELVRLRALISELKAISLDMHPHVRVLFADEVATDSQVDDAARAFEVGALRVGRWLDVRREPYSFSQLRGLVADLKTWLKSEEGDVLDRFDRVVEILPPAKKLLISGLADQIEGESWLPLMRLTGEGFRVYLDFRHAFRTHLNDGLMRERMPHAMAAISRILESALSRRGGAGLPLAEWRHLFDHLERSELLPKAMTAEAMDGAFQWLIVRALGHGTKTDYVDVLHARRLLEQSRIWRELRAREEGREYTPIPEMAAFDEVIRRSAPMHWDSEGRLEMKRQVLPAWTTADRQRLLWPFALLNWVKTSYIGARPHMTEDEISFAVTEILPRLQKFGWMSETKLTIGKRILREADLFTTASSGDFELDLAEATRYLAFVASGLRIAELWLEEADKECGSREALCVRELATHAQSRALESLPHLRARVLNGDPKWFIKYMQQSEETVLGKVTVGPMSTKNILQAMQLFQYVEAFLYIYDGDVSETINLTESGPAFNKYGPTLAKLLRATNMPSDEIWAFFTFMMKYGDTPFGMFGGQVLFNHWKWHRNDWAFEAERGTLMSILNQLSKL